MNGFSDNHRSATILITNAKVVTLQEVIQEGYVLIRDNLIAEVGHKSDFSKSVNDDCDQIVDAADGYLIPGFVDLHVHGGVGYDFMDATEEAFQAITNFHAQHGTTSMLATTMTAGLDQIHNVLSAIQQYRAQPMPYAQIIGVHLEGPFISRHYPGAQNPSYISPIRLDWVNGWIQQFPSMVKMLTFAPELPQSAELMEILVNAGILAACGHTNATYAEIQKAVPHGLQHAVHSYNAMRGLHHREPGTLGAVLAMEQLTAEIIADGYHVHPACISLLTKLKNNHNLILVTDAISAAGLGDGEYMLGGLEVEVKQGIARLKDKDTLAGSTLTMLKAFQYMIHVIGLSVQQASELASYNPALAIGMQGHFGSIAEGLDANLLLMDGSYELQKVWIKGRQVH